MDKILIVVVGEEKTGKTTFFNNLWDLLPTYVKKINYYNLPHEIRGCVEAYEESKKGIKRPLRICVNSIGDTIDEIRIGLVDMLFDKPDIMVCACHTIKDMIKSINSLSDTKPSKNMAERDITKAFLEKAQSMIGEYKLVTFSPLTKYIPPIDRKAISKCTVKELYENMRVNDINISRLSAKCIVEFIETLNQ